MDAFHSIEFAIGGSWLAEYTLRAVGAGVVVFDATGCATQWDESGPRLLGVSDRQLAGRALHDEVIGAEWLHGWRVTPDDDPVLGVLVSGETTSGHLIRVTDTDGVAAWRSLTLLPVFGVDRAPRAVLASIVDATAATEARSATTSWHLALRAMMRAGVAATVLLDRHGEILECNDQLYELTGRTELELLACRFTDVCDVDVDWLWNELDAADDSGVHGPTWLLRAGRDEIAVHGWFSVLDHPDLGRVAMAQLLPPSGADDRPVQPTPGGAAFERSLVPMLVVTDMGVVVDANPAAETEIGMARAHLAGEPVLVGLVGLERQALHQAIGDAELLRDAVEAGSCTVGEDLRTVFVSSMPGMPGLFLIQLPATVLDHSAARPESRPVV